MERYKGELMSEERLPVRDREEIETRISFLFVSPFCIHTALSIGSILTTHPHPSLLNTNRATRIYRAFGLTASTAWLDALSVRHGAAQETGD